MLNNVFKTKILTSQYEVQVKGNQLLQKCGDEHLLFSEFCRVKTINSWNDVNSEMKSITKKSSACSFSDSCRNKPVVFYKS